MTIKRILKVLMLLFFIRTPCGYALELNEILIIANKNIPESIEIAEYYCIRRGVPKDNILALALGESLSDTISRSNYDKQLVEPIREALSKPEFEGKIRCLLTIYGVPYKVGGRGQLEGYDEKLEQLKKEKGEIENALAHQEQSNSNKTSKKNLAAKHNLRQVNLEIEYILGKHTNASVDSELSMLLFGQYELYKWQPNGLNKKVIVNDHRTLMVSRLDGPTPEITKGLIDKAKIAELFGLSGTAYIDSRGIPNDKNPYSFGHFDQSLRNLAIITKFRTEMPVEEEKTQELFKAGQCPQTAIYCGWYSVKKYVDAFDFVDGAVGYHIASWEAVNLHDPNSTQWCPAMLKDGITATMGAVDEPYLHSFPEPEEFFSELFNGLCLVEAYYRTKPFNSWQMLLIGDPLYTPFKKH